MTEAILALVPDYGLLIVFIVVFLGTFGAPMPTSMLVLAAGGFAASGDLNVWAVLGITLLAFLIGDQLAFGAAKSVGPKILSTLRRNTTASRLVDRADALLDERGPAAVFLSHTVLSPTCAYVTYLGGLTGLTRMAHSTAAIAGASVWNGAYVGLGYAFASRLNDISTIMGNLIGMIAAGAVLWVSFRWLHHRWEEGHHLTEA